MTTATETKAKHILPNVTDLNRPFWDGCRDRRLMLQCCDKCGFHRYPAAPVCPRCLSPDATWKPASGRGTLHSFVIFHRAYHPDWQDKVPYNVSLVEIEEGPILLTNVVGIENDKLKVGMALQVDFEALDETAWIPVFRPT
jgi:uncharacterized OB-fold protein